MGGNTAILRIKPSLTVLCCGEQVTNTAALLVMAAWKKSCTAAQADINYIQAIHLLIWKLNNTCCAVMNTQLHKLRRTVSPLGQGEPIILKPELVQRMGWNPQCPSTNCSFGKRKSWSWVNRYTQEGYRYRTLEAHEDPVLGKKKQKKQSHANLDLSICFVCHPLDNIYVKYLSVKNLIKMTINVLTINVIVQTMH